MGTSKGYISPSSPKWALTKRGISAYVSNPTALNLGECVSRYARAIAEDSTMTQKASVIFSNFSSFVLQSKSQGLLQTINDFQLDHISALPPEDALREIICAFIEGATIDDNIANDCIFLALEELDVKTIDDLTNLEVNVLIKELVCQFAKQKFVQMFNKHLNNKCDNILIAKKRMNEIQEYIYNRLMIDLTPEKLDLINPLNLANEEIVENTMKEAFSILEYYYD